MLGRILSDNLRTGLVATIARSCVEAAKRYWIALAIIAIGSVAVILYSLGLDYWAERTFNSSGQVTDIKIDRVKIVGQIVLGFAGALAFAPAVWRTVTAHRQAEAALHQARIAADNMRLAERGQNVERYAKAAAMLGDERISVRQAGVYSLRELANVDPDGHLSVVIHLLAGFIRDRAQEPTDTPALDLIDAFNAFGGLRFRWRSKLPGSSGPYFVFNKLVLSDVIFSDLDLSLVRFDNCVFQTTTWMGCILERTVVHAGLSRTLFSSCMMSGSRFSGAAAGDEAVQFLRCDLTDADLSEISGKTMGIYICNVSGISLPDIVSWSVRRVWAWADRRPNLWGLIGTMDLYDPGPSGERRNAYMRDPKRPARRPPEEWRVERVGTDD